MLYCWTVGNLVQKQKIVLNNWNLIKKTFKLTGSVSPNTLLHTGPINLFKNVQASSQSGKNPSHFCRNFSTAVVARSNKQGVNQDKEKLKNYIQFGVLTLICGSVFIFNMTVEHTHDKVYIQAPSK